MKFTKVVLKCNFVSFKMVKKLSLLLVVNWLQTLTSLPEVSERALSVALFV